MKRIKIEEIRQIQLNILKYVDEICKNNGIEYFLISGSLLGAVRHNGYIPWDDDIDIALTTENYNKLRDILSKDNDSNYIALDKTTQKDYYYPFMKIADKRTKLIENNQREIENYGVHIDVFEYSRTTNIKEKREKQFKKIKKYKMHVYYYSCKKYLKKNVIKKFIRFVYTTSLRIIGIKKILKKYESLHHKFENEDGDYAISNWPSYDLDHEIQEMKNLNDLVYHKFEDIEAKIPGAYDLILKKQFGNYMELPPEEKRISNHDVEAYWK